MNFPIRTLPGNIIHKYTFCPCAIYPNGIAAGTLLYVTFFEIFAAEGRTIQCKLGHIALAMLGFLLMALLEFVGGHQHGHGNHYGMADPIRGINETHKTHHHSHSNGQEQEHSHSATPDDHVH